ncbi:MAG: hypothetical protein K0S39_1046 [Paenibacillus sp.]|nr:hypothetical protein [Paenibacillus sp.]
MNKRDHVPTLIIGASMLGLGIAFSKERDAMVLESSNGVGNEYIRSFKFSRSSCSPATSKGTELQQECARRGIMDSEGRMHLPGLMPVMIKHIKEADLDVKMQTSVVEVKQRDGQFEVLYYDASGLRTLVADRLVDTTSVCLTKPACFQAKSKSLNMMLNALPEQLDVTGTKDYSIRRGRFESEIVLRFGVEPEDDWISARNKLFQFWLNRPSALTSCAFVTHADEFDMEYDLAHQPISPGWDWLPSAYYSNPLEAFDHGFRYGKGEC